MPVDAEIDTRTAPSEYIKENDKDDHYKHLGKRVGVPQNINDFKEFAEMMSAIFLGNQKDKLLDSLNSFLCNLYNVRTVLVENHFPPLILHVLYFPICFVILTLNVVRMEIAQFIMSFALLMFAMVVSGLIFTLLFLYGKAASQKMREEQNAEDEDES